MSDDEKTREQLIAELSDLRERVVSLESIEAEMHGIYRALMDIVLIIDSRGRYVRVPLTQEDDLVQHLEQFIGKTMYDSLPKEQADEFLEYIQQVLETHETMQIEYTLEIEGQILWRDAIIVPLSNNRTLWMIRDTTWRKQAEQELQHYQEHLQELVKVRTDELLRETSTRQKTQETLRKSEEQFQRLLGSVQDAIWAASANRSELLYVNPAFEQLYQRKSQEFQEDPQLWLKAVHPDDQEIATKSSQELFEKGHSEVEYRIIRPDGSMRWIADRKSLTYDSDGVPIQMGGVATDITNRKETELALQKARESAEVANYAKSMFLANMSHELRTPLNAILGFAQILTYDQHLAPQQQQYLTSIMNSGEHLVYLVNDILEMSKIEAGQIKLNEVDFDLYDLLGKLKEVFSLQAENKNLQLTFQIMDHVPQHLHADAVKLRQILTNLLRNAMKFTKIGHITLRIRHETDSYDTFAHTRLLFDVEDTGVGISPDELEHLFQPFTQASNNEQTQDGVGLGLAITRHLIHTMGGDIRVQSEVNKGSRFSFDIRATLTQPGKIEPERNRVVGIQEGSPTYRILIVDDDPNQRTALAALLELVGFQVREATDGQDGITIWKKWHPHLIWMDMRMPVMDGYEATRQIKADPQGAETIIIALTAAAFMDDRKAVFEAGCDDHLAKPYRDHELFQMMETHLGIQFIYKDSQQDTIIQTALLSKLPQDLTEQLKQTALIADKENMEDIIKEIAIYEPVMAKQLGKWASIFRFDKILDFVEIWEKENR